MCKFFRQFLCSRVYQTVDFNFGFEFWNFKSVNSVNCVVCLPILFKLKTSTCHSRRVGTGQLSIGFSQQLKFSYWTPFHSLQSLSFLTASLTVFLSDSLSLWQSFSLIVSYHFTVSNVTSTGSSTTADQRLGDIQWAIVRQLLFTIYRILRTLLPKANRRLIIAN